MVHSINNNRYQPVNTEQSATTKSNKKAEHAVAAEPHIELQVKALREDIQSASEINQSRVEFLQKELAGGRYKVNSLVIADKLMNEFNKLS